MSARILHRWCDEWELLEFPAQTSSREDALMLRNPKRFVFEKAQSRRKPQQPVELRSDAFDE